MIFALSDHREQILRGTKVQTRRDSGRYQIGRTYAIQPCRTCKGIPEGRILIKRKWREYRADPSYLSISREDAQAEGGYAPQNYEALYEKKHHNWGDRWAYEFEFVPA